MLHNYGDAQLYLNVQVVVIILNYRTFPVEENNTPDLFTCTYVIDNAIELRTLGSIAW